MGLMMFHVFCFPVDITRANVTNVNGIYLHGGQTLEVPKFSDVENFSKWNIFTEPGFYIECITTNEKESKNEYFPQFYQMEFCFLF